MVGTSGWVEAFPTKRETAITGAKKLLGEIIPRFRVPDATGSDSIMDLRDHRPLHVT